MEIGLENYCVTNILKLERSSRFGIVQCIPADMKINGKHVNSMDEEQKVLDMEYRKPNTVSPIVEFPAELETNQGIEETLQAVQ